ncbi:hypothetical protein F5Y18DRAFT_412183 [Xylariaceae sp. FL1019]|nr:hypothetical protein F5Y18DRAFT_412183 [Xylariaceae sp. FL1019]
MTMSYLMHEINNLRGGVTQQITYIGRQLGLPTVSAYCASKWALQGVCRRLHRKHCQEEASGLEYHVHMYRAGGIQNRMGSSKYGLSQSKAELGSIQPCTSRAG